MNDGFGAVAFDGPSSEMTTVRGIVSFAPAPTGVAETVRKLPGVDWGGAVTANVAVPLLLVTTELSDAPAPAETPTVSR